MLKKTDSALQYTNAFLAKRYDEVSPDNGDGTIVQSQTGGGDGAGSIEFTPNTDVNGGSYPLYIGSHFDAADTWIIQRYIEQTATQDSLGGRLVTFVDAPEDVFGATVQVAVNLMSDSTLQVTRAISPNTGIILRGIDQGVDAQMELLGTGNALTGNGYLEVKVVFNDSTGTVEGWWTEDGTNTTTKILDLSSVNTAVSGLNECTDILEGGYGVTGDGDTTLHHEDLAAKLSNLMIINSIPVAGDPFAPVDRIGPQKPVMLLPTADDGSAQWTPDPVQDHYLNVNEVPPDSETTENTAATTGLRDSFQMQTAGGTGDDQAHLAYTGFVEVDTPAECGSSGSAANFEAFVYMTQPAAGTVETSTSDTSPCNLTDFVSRRAQSLCTIKAEGESVTFKPNADNTGAYYAFLTPLNAPPRVQNAAGPTRYQAAIFAPTVSQNVEVVPAEARYLLPNYQPWMGYAVDTQDQLDSNGDFVDFQVSYQGIGLDAGLLDNATVNSFNPYTSELIALHFREDVIGSPYYWIGTSFTYAGETTYSFLDTDIFTILRSGGNVIIKQNGIVKETIPITYPTHTNFFAFMGKWGWDAAALPPSYSLRPGVRNVFVRIGGTDCVTAIYTYNNLVAGTWLTAHQFEWGQWGVEFNSGGSGGDATVYDPNNPNTPTVPVFGFDTNTTIQFALVGGNVVLTVTDFVSYCDNFDSVVGPVGTYTYSRPYADTDDFQILPPADAYPIGPPVFPFPSMEFAYTNGVANMPLRLGVVCTENSDFALPDRAGVRSTSFQFIAGQNPTGYAGYMSAGSDKDGNTVIVPTTYAYRQSMLSTDPDGNPITINSFNAATGHGYTDPE